MKLGEGRLPSAKTEEQTCPDTDVIEILHDMFWESKEEVIEEIFEDFEANIGNSGYFQSRVLLTATNQIINEVNNEMVDRMPGDLHWFTSVDTVDDLDDATMFPTKYLNTLSLSGLPEHELNLKVDIVVILLRNMDIKVGHCNGTRYLVKHIGQFRLVLYNKFGFKSGLRMCSPTYKNTQETMCNRGLI